MTNVMSSRSGCFYEAVTAAEAVTRSGGSVLEAPVSIVVGAPQRGHSPASGNRRMPLLPQTVHPQARKTPRSETTKQQRRSREAGAPSSRRPGAAEGALPRVARP